MLIFADIRIPTDALKTLEKFGEVVKFETKGITYDAISGHPDVFLCQTPNNLIVAPNIPKKYVNILNKINIQFTFGNYSVGEKYPESAHYNALVTENYILHNADYTDKKILELCVNKVFINVNQAYTRCNTIYVGDCYITSDRPIYNVLRKTEAPVTYVNPESVLLSGFKNGFFGGCCGVYENKLFVCGSLNNIANDQKDKILGLTNIEIIELYSGQLYDAGGILFLE